MKEEAGEERKEHVGSSLEPVGMMVVGAVFVVGSVCSLAWDAMMVAGGSVVNTMMVGGGNMMMVGGVNMTMVGGANMTMDGGAVAGMAAGGANMTMDGGAVADMAAVVGDPN